MDGVVFSRVGNEIYPNKQFVGSFFVSRELLWKAEIEVRPLTIDHLIRGLARNTVTQLYWIVTRILYLSGFLNSPEGAELDWKTDWRWKFWETIESRRLY